MNNIFDSRTLNIFTDASMKTLKSNESVGSAGVCLFEGSIFKDIKTNILRYSTNNNSEISAISFGVMEAIKYKNSYDTVNLFSDSKICIFGLREWIFRWIKGNHGNTLYGSAGTPVSNQGVILGIIYNIINNDLKINLYHQSGHVITNNMNSLYDAKNIFLANNNMADIDIDTIKFISDCNNFIDVYTRNCLIDYLDNLGKPAISFIYGQEVNFNKYKKLIGMI